MASQASGELATTQPATETCPTRPTTLGAQFDLLEQRLSRFVMRVKIQASFAKTPEFYRTFNHQQELGLAIA